MLVFIIVGPVTKHFLSPLPIGFRALLVGLACGLSCFLAILLLDVWQKRNTPRP